MTEQSSNRQFHQSAKNQVPSANQTEDEIIDLGELVGTLWRGKWLISVIAGISVLLGGYYAFVSATPMFKATAVVMLETKQENVIDLHSVVGGLSGDSSEINSEVEVLRSRGLMGKVVDRLNLVEDPEFNGLLQPESQISILKSHVKDALGLTREEIQLPPEEEAKRIRDGVISALLEKVEVSNIPLSLVFSVTAETEGAAKSAMIADTIVELYILNQLEVKFEATEQASSWLAGRVSELQGDLEVAEAKLADFSSSTDLISAEALQAQEFQLKELRERIGGLSTALATASERVAKLKAAETREDQAKLANDPQLSRLLSRAQSEADVFTLFDNRFEQVVTRAQVEETRTQQQLTALRGSEQEVQAQLTRRGQDLITLQQLTREAEAIRLLYEHFLTRLKETSAQKGIQKADSRILSNAVVPARASSPKKPRILAVSGIFGLMIGVGLVLLKEARSNGFRTTRSLESHTGFPVLGQIPRLPVKNRKQILQYLVEKPTSASAEAIRNLRTSVLLSNADNPPQVIVSTSSVPGEGKTTNSIALAQNLTGLGKSVLLIECDIRRRTFRLYFDDFKGKGIASVISGESTLAEAVVRSDLVGADILVGEQTNTNAADLFSSERFKSIIQEARTQYDVIIIDTPPVLIVPDARIISQVADIVLFSVLWDKTSKHQVEEALRMFDHAKAKPTGLVLSQIDGKRMKKYGYDGRYGAYSNYGRKYYDN